MFNMLYIHEFNVLLYVTQKIIKNPFVLYQFASGDKLAISLSSSV